MTGDEYTATCMGANPWEKSHDTQQTSPTTWRVRNNGSTVTGKPIRIESLVAYLRRARRGVKAPRRVYHKIYGSQSMLGDHRKGTTPETYEPRTSSTESAADRKLRMDRIMADA